MKILIINNHTKHLDELRQLFERYGETTTVDKLELKKDHIYEEYNLIVLSGSSAVSVKDKPQAYEKELLLIKQTQVPIIGVCMGAELIAYAYGGTLRKLKHKLISLEPLQFISHSLPISQANTIERHSRVIESLGDQLEALAQSDYGYEIIKHKTKSIYGLQFHPEIDPQSQQGDEIVDCIMAQIINSLQNKYGNITR